MKRAIAITLTVALLGTLFMGFVGSAAAQPANNDGGFDLNIETGDTGDVEQEAEQEAEIEQENNNYQVGVANADADAKSGGDAEAEAELEQDQDVRQGNYAEIEQEIEQEGESGDSGIAVFLGGFL